ncbi:Fe-ABC transporter ATP-binding subunit [Psychromonas sp. CNPT3]|uniref:ABC transporter ATP-binding protein n=1 Tax=Psychromonas sp. CNPT3 TaxID=314282 RepID=UPI00006E3A61|nr:ABC transporter ATP-binding protein [Psychromonas sp. CNPT3]AGH81391.1 Fe-ABC transporter ATP-binding subunit [Psychromonas sp. CNPT3]
MSLILNNLSVSYARQQVLKGASIESLNSGSFTCLLGPNAAGKSTLFKAIAGLVKLDSGKIFLHGADVSSFSRKERAQKIAYLPQSFHSNVSLTVYESILLSLKHQSNWRVKQTDLLAVAAILEQLCITKLADVDICNLSGGQQQMVAMARVLVRSPEVILLDEPTSALDLHYQLSILSVVKELTISKNMITVAALHDLNLASKFCDQLALLSAGKIQIQGTPESVLGSPILAEAYKVNTTLESTSNGQLYVDAQLKQL